MSSTFFFFFPHDIQSTPSKPEEESPEALTRPLNPLPASLVEGGKVFLNTEVEGTCFPVFISSIFSLMFTL
jgi:hypothetical protein